MAFIEEAARLLREKWADVNMAMEEVYTIFGTWGQRGVIGPMKVQIPEQSSQPAMEVDAIGPGPVFVINRADGSRLEMDQDGNLETFNDEDDFEGAEAGGGGGTPVVAGGGGLMGKIVSGSGQTYVVNLYAAGLSAAATGQVTATAPYLDDDEEIPVDTTVGVIVAGDVYHLQVLGYWL